MGRVIHDDGNKSPKMNANAPASRPATATGKYVQSFDEIAVMTEQPAKAAPWVPRGNPKRDSTTPANGTPRLLASYDDRQNLRADGKVLVRETPDSKKTDKDARPNGLRVYRQQAGEDLP